MLKNENNVAVNAEQIKKLAKMLAESKGAQKAMPMSAKQWEEFLSNAGEGVIEDGFTILNEEAEMREDLVKEGLRKKQVNKARFLQREEQLKMEAQQLSNQNKNV